MPYKEAKVYCDGSHFIAIPHTTNPTKRRIKFEEELINVEEPILKQETESVSPKTDDTLILRDEKQFDIKTNESSQSFDNKPQVKMTKKELFNKLYEENINLSKANSKKIITVAMRQYFKTEEAVQVFVETNFLRRKRNLICRRIRCMRKANLQNFNYFVTFTYDGNIHTEETFRSQLRNCLRNQCNRKSWRYMGVWERSPEKKRLHFHGLFNIPEGTMPGLLIEKNDYSFNNHKRQVTVQNTYFNERFGRSDFEMIENRSKLGEAVNYILKYIEKTGERIVYSKGLPQFFISDIMEYDVICKVGIEEKKLLLYDDFKCFDEGCYVGKVSADTIKQMRTSN